MFHPIKNSLLRKFNREFDSNAEDIAGADRGAFITAFPISSLKRLSVDDYIIGKRQPTFCAYVEPLTESWASIWGATALKFGIYYGKKKPDKNKRYRFSKKFGTSRAAAFSEVKTSLLALVSAGKAKDFRAVDKNKLSQMFKAKILSLYFPEIYLNVCSGQHIKLLAKRLGIPTVKPISEQQHLLLKAKLHNPITKKWSNHKYTTFLYNTYIRKAPERINLLSTRKKPPKLNMAEMLERRRIIGEMSERFALDWEKKRLIGLDYKKLIREIDDRTKKPAYGYDFLSHTDEKTQRYIEVNTAGRNWTGKGFRFFLTQNEYNVSRSSDHSRNYYFYLVFFKDKKPFTLKEEKASDFYKMSKRGPNGYVLTFDLEDV